MSCRGFLAVVVFLITASCSDNVRLQSADLPFDPAFTSELAAVSKRFASMKGLSFEDHARGASRTMTLRGDQFEIDATVENRRLQIALFGPTSPKPTLIAIQNLGGQYICVAQKVGQINCPQCAVIALEDMRDECPPSAY
jgi:hypothetical protein